VSSGVVLLDWTKTTLDSGSMPQLSINYIIYAKIVYFEGFYTRSQSMPTATIKATIFFWGTPIVQHLPDGCNLSSRIPLNLPSSFPQNLLILLSSPGIGLL
jgi:hypothetical protein